MQEVKEKFLREAVRINPLQILFLGGMFFLAGLGVMYFLLVIWTEIERWKNEN